MDTTPPEVVGAVGRYVPFSQGSVTACAHICAAVAGSVVRLGTDMLAPQLVLDVAKLTAAGETGIASYRYALDKRRREAPGDKSSFFTPGHAIWRAEEIARNKGVVPYWERREDSGYLTVRGDVPPDANGSAGFMPSLADVVETTWRRAQDTGKYHATVITDSNSYTRMAVFAPNHTWFYDSHGMEHSTLYWFGDRVDWLLVHILRKAGLSDQGELEDARERFLDPSKRRAVPFSPVIDGLYRRFEAVTVWSKSQ